MVVFQTLVDRVLRSAQDDFAYHSAVMVTVTVVSGGLNYAYQIFMGRALGPEQYAVFGALFALFYLLSVLGRGVQLNVSHVVADHRARRKPLAALYRRLWIRVALLGLGMGCLVLVGTGPLQTFLGVDPALLGIVAVLVPVSLVFTANQGAVQGLEKFGWLGAYKTGAAGLKLVLGIALVLTGFGVYGAFGAVVVAMAVLLVGSSIHIWNSLESASPSENSARPAGASLGWLPVLAGLCIMLPGNADVLLVKHFFPAAEAGRYVAVTVFGKILIFLPLGISTALFPKATHAETLGDAGRLHARFRQAVGYTLLVGGSGTLLFVLVPEQLLEFLYGPAYVSAAPLVRWYSVAILAFSVAVVALNVQLARRRAGFIYLFTAISLAGMCAVWFAHDSLATVAQILLGTNVLLAVVGIVGASR